MAAGFFVHSYSWALWSSRNWELKATAPIHTGVFMKYFLSPLFFVHDLIFIEVHALLIVLSVCVCAYLIYVWFACDLCVEDIVARFICKLPL